MKMIIFFKREREIKIVVVAASDFLLICNLNVETVKVFREYCYDNYLY